MRERPKPHRPGIGARTGNLNPPCSQALLPAHSDRLAGDRAISRFQMENTHDTLCGRRLHDQ